MAPLTIRIDNDEFRRSTLGGPSRVTVASLAAADRALAPHGVRVPASVRDIAGALDADVELSGTMGAPARRCTRAPRISPCPGWAPRR